MKDESDSAANLVHPSSFILHPSLPVRVKWCGAQALNVRAHRGSGDRAGKANPTGSKAKYGERVGSAHHHPRGRLLDPSSNRRTREMTVAALLSAGQNPAYRPTVQLSLGCWVVRLLGG